MLWTFACSELYFERLQRLVNFADLNEDYAQLREELDLSMRCTALTTVGIVVVCIFISFH